MPRPVPVADIRQSDWRIAVAAMNPIGGEAERDRYRHPAFGFSRSPAVYFAGGYDNPWIAPVLLEAIASYHGHGGDMPHVVRWRISLAFLAGRLSELIGDRSAAKLWYVRAATGDWKRFSSILATKVIGAAFFAGRLCLAERNPIEAWAWFQHGVDTALQAGAGDHRKDLGTAETLLPFYLPELAEVIDMGSQCAIAVAHAPLWQRDPGLFWRQVDVKRFGLASWVIDVAQDNDRLRKMVAQAA